MEGERSKERRIDANDDDERDSNSFNKHRL
jgi:hypothetical protein